MRFSQLAPVRYLPRGSAAMRLSGSSRLHFAPLCFPSSRPEREARRGGTFSLPPGSYRGDKVSPRGPSGLGRDDGAGGWVAREGLPGLTRRSANWRQLGLLRYPPQGRGGKVSHFEGGVPDSWTERPPMLMPSAFTPSNPSGRLWTGGEA